jgi:hypothetical protein
VVKQTIIPSWLTSQGAFDWYKAEAAKIEKMAMECPELAIQVPLDIAAFMGAIEEENGPNLYEDYDFAAPVRDIMEAAKEDLGILFWN